MYYRNPMQDMKTVMWKLYDFPIHLFLYYAGSLYFNKTWMKSKHPSQFINKFYYKKFNQVKHQNNFLYFADRKIVGTGFETLRKKSADFGTLGRGTLERRSTIDKRLSWNADDLGENLNSFRPVTLTVNSFFKQVNSKLNLVKLPCICGLKNSVIV